MVTLTTAASFNSFYSLSTTVLRAIRRALTPPPEAGPIVAPGSWTTTALMLSFEPGHHIERHTYMIRYHQRVKHDNFKQIAFICSSQHTYLYLWKYPQFPPQPVAYWTPPLPGPLWPAPHSLGSTSHPTRHHTPR